MFKKIKTGIFLSSFALLAPNLSAEILFRDEGTYIINGFAMPATPLGGQWFSGPTLRYIVLPYPLALGTNVTIQVTISDFSIGTAGAGNTVFSLDAYDDDSYISNAGSIQVPAYTNGLLSLTLTVTDVPLGSNPVMRANFTQITSWSNTSYVVLSDFCIFTGSTCSNSPSSANTLASFLPNAFALRKAFNLQSTKIAQGLSYDCTVYDQKNICVSFAGSKSDGKGFDATTGALIIAHKTTTNFRFGGYIDQSFGSSTSGGLTTKKGNPGFGAFAVWSQKADGSGVQVRAAANVGKVDVETTREAIESAEAGFGKSNIKSQGFSLEVSKDYSINSMWTARPYVGYRKTTNTRAGYTETQGAESPLTYGSLKQNTETVTAGATFAHALSAKTTLFLTAGIEHDLKNSIGRYAATSPDIEGIDSIDMGSNKTKTRPTMSFALNHDIDKTQRVGVSFSHRKEAFASGSTTSAFLHYSKGF